MFEFEICFIANEVAPGFGAVKTSRIRADTAQLAVNHTRQTYGANITITTVKKLDQLFGEWS